MLVHQSVIQFQATISNDFLLIIHLLLIHRLILLKQNFPFILMPSLATLHLMNDKYNFRQNIKKCRLEQFSNSKSPLRPQGQNNNNKSSIKYSYINDYQKFLDKKDEQSDTKSQTSYVSNNYNKSNKSLSSHNINPNKTYNFGNKSISNGADIGLPP